MPGWHALAVGAAPEVKAGRSWLVAGMNWIMIAAGALTCTMLYAAIAPQAALRSTFAETLEGPLAVLIDSVMVALFAAYLVAVRGRPCS